MTQPPTDSARGVDVVAKFSPSPEQLAAAFWNMDAEQQADFFAELERLAGYKLCLQMAGVVDVLQQRASTGDYLPLHGFQTMLSHAQGYHETAAFYRAEDAKRAIRELARTP